MSESKPDKWMSWVALATAIMPLWHPFPDGYFSF